MNPVEEEIIKYLDHKRKTIFDIGCFRGTFTKKLLACKKNQQINFDFFLFDPNPNVKNYIQNLTKNEKVRYFDLALDDSNCKKKFYLNNFFEPSGSSLKTVAKDDKKWNMTRRAILKILQPFKKIGSFSEIIVQTKTLDNFCFEKKIENIDVLKIDSESNELNILNGARNLLERNKIYLIYTEISESKNKFDFKEKTVFDFLKNYNFELKKKYDIKSASFLSDMKATDNIFVNKYFSV